jgi:RNA polymerase sigma factor for flagellar operon FliA
MVLEITETDLWKKFLETHSPELREELVLRSVALVHYLLGRLGISQDMGMEYEDLAHQGLLGLIEAVDRYNPSYGTKFSTYASVRIRGKVLDYLRSSDWMSRGARQRVRTLQNAITSLWEKNQREPSEDEIAQHLGIQVGVVQQALMDSNRVVLSLDSLMVNDKEGDLSLYEVIPDDGQPDPLELFSNAEMRDRLADAIRLLSEREQLVLSLYYMEELTLKEIGKVLEISESRVSQIHAKAILNLKAVLKDG